MIELKMEIDNLTPEQLTVIRKLAWMAESYCDQMEDLASDTEAADAFHRHAEECMDLWNAIVKKQKRSDLITRLA